MNIDLFQERKVSLFSSKYSVAKTVTIKEMVEWLTNGHFKSVINGQKSLEGLVPLTPEWKAAKDKMKARLECWTPSCVIREGEHRGDGNIEKMSGIMAFDFDLKDQTDKEYFLKEFKGSMVLFPSVFYAGLSASNSGFFVLALTDSVEPERYKPTYQAISEEFAKIGWVTDAVASSLSNFRFVSYDPQPYINLEVEPYKSVAAEEVSCFAPQKKAYVATEIRVKSKQEEYEEILRIIRENPNSGISDVEGEWFGVGLAFAKHFGEAGRALYHEYSALWPRYRAKDVDKKYDWCLAKGDGSVSIAKFFWVCQQHGIQL